MQLGPTLGPKTLPTRGLVSPKLGPRCVHVACGTRAKRHARNITKNNPERLAQERPRKLVGGGVLQNQEHEDPKRAGTKRIPHCAGGAWRIYVYTWSYIYIYIHTYIYMYTYKTSLKADKEVRGSWNSRSTHVQLTFNSMYGSHGNLCPG